MPVGSRLLLHVFPLVKIPCKHHRIVQIDIRHDGILPVCHDRL